MYKENEKKTKEKLVLRIAIFLVLILTVLTTSLNSFAYTTGDQIVAREGTKVPTLMKFGDMYILCTIAEVYKDGNKYFAYCIEPKKDGVEVLGNYNLTISKQITDNRIFSVLKHGYPNKTPKELGVNSAGEAFLATTQAIYTLIFDRSVNDYSPVDSEAGRRTYAAYKQIVVNAKNNPFKEEKAKISINEESEWNLSEDNLFLEKNFSITSSNTNGKYNLSLKNNNIDAEIITMEKARSLNNLSVNSGFTLKVPIKNLEDVGSLDIEISSEAESSVIYEAKPSSSTAQKLAVVGLKTKYDVLNNINVEYFKNETKLELLKVEDKSGLPLEGVAFNIYDSNNELVYENVKTNSEGKIIIEGIIPGKYTVKEIEAKPGYLLSEETIEIELKYNETTEIQIENIKKEVPKKPTPKKVLPQTGY